MFICQTSSSLLGCQVVPVVKNLPANPRQTGLIPGSGISPGRGNGIPLQYSCRRIPWTEEPGGLQPTGRQRVGNDWVSGQQQQTFPPSLPAFLPSPPLCLPPSLPPSLPHSLATSVTRAEGSPRSCSCSPGQPVPAVPFPGVSPGFSPPRDHLGIVSSLGTLLPIFS